MHAVRKRILEILKEWDGATVADLAAELEMAPVSVRHHLDILQGDDLICVDRVKRKGNVGRPQQVYTLTAAANDYFPNNFAALAAGLVCQIKAVLPPDQVQCAFRSLARELAAELDAQDWETASLAERVARVAEFLSEQGYLARWEPADEAEAGYLLHKYNCPYAGVSENHHELCMMDQELVNQLMGQPCRRTQSLAEDGHCCTYRINLVEENLPEEDARRQAEPDWTLQAATP